MDQKSRMETLDAFKTNKLTLLVASDVAARGLDIPAVSHVYNFDVPVHAEDYVHRIGRTGRAGRSGVAYTFVAPADEKHLDAIVKLIQKQIDWLEPTKSARAEAAEAAPAAEDGEAKPSRGRRGGRTRKTAKTEVTASAPTEVETEIVDEPLKPQKTRADNTRRKRNSDDVAVVTPNNNGPFGDAGPIPAFLLRPTRIAQ
jgi:superfamily II DNA/RNA helicase